MSHRRVCFLSLFMLLPTVPGWAAQAGGPPAGGSTAAVSWQVPIPQVLATFLGFLLMVLLLSVIAEKLTDLVKQIWTGLFGAPEPPLSDQFGFNYGKLVALKPEHVPLVLAILRATELDRPSLIPIGDRRKAALNSTRLAEDCALARDKLISLQQTLESLQARPETPATPGSDTLLVSLKTVLQEAVATTQALVGSLGGSEDPASREAGQIEEIYRLDRLRRRDNAQWTWQWRLVAVLFGAAAAWACRANAFTLLYPILGDEFHKALPDTSIAYHAVGLGMTGFAASLGASYWHDFLDNVTRTRKAAKTVETGS
jgi:hypothetical protein